MTTDAKLLSEAELENAFRYCDPCRIRKHIDALTSQLDAARQEVERAKGELKPFQNGDVLGQAESWMQCASRLYDGIDINGFPNPRSGSGREIALQRIDWLLEQARQLAALSEQKDDTCKNQITNSTSLLEASKLIYPIIVAQQAEEISESKAAELIGVPVETLRNIKANCTKAIAKLVRELPSPLILLVGGTQEKQPLSMPKSASSNSPGAETEGTDAGSQKPKSSDEQLAAIPSPADLETIAAEAYLIVWPDGNWANASEPVKAKWRAAVGHIVARSGALSAPGECRPSREELGKEQFRIYSEYRKSKKHGLRISWSGLLNEVQEIYMITAEALYSKGYADALSQHRQQVAELEGTIADLRAKLDECQEWQETAENNGWLCPNLRDDIREKLRTSEKECGDLRGQLRLLASNRDAWELSSKTHKQSCDLLEQERDLLTAELAQLRQRLEEAERERDEARKWNAEYKRRADIAREDKEKHEERHAYITAEKILADHFSRDDWPRWRDFVGDRMGNTANDWIKRTPIILEPHIQRTLEELAGGVSGYDTDRDRLAAELAAAKEQLAIAKEAGLSIGTLKEAGKEPRLTWDIVEGSPLDNEIGNVADLVAKNAELEKQLAAREGELERVKELVGWVRMKIPEWGVDFNGVLDELKKLSPGSYRASARLDDMWSVYDRLDLDSYASPSAPATQPDSPRSEPTEEDGTSSVVINTPTKERTGRVRELATSLGRWPTAIEYHDHGLHGDGGQCDCNNMGDCALRGDSHTCDRRCYATLLRDRLVLVREGFSPSPKQPDSPPAFRCPKCGCTKLFGRDNAFDEPLMCDSASCNWSGTWAEVAAAKGGEGQA